MLRAIGWTVFWVVVVIWISRHPQTASGIVTGIGHFVSDVLS